MRALHVAMAALGLSLLSPAAGAPRVSHHDRRALARAEPPSRTLPVRFEENVGQAGARVRFVGRARGATVYLTDEEAAVSLGDTLLHLTVANARRVIPRAEKRLATISSYFIGDDPSRWRTGVGNFARVVYPGVLDGVDLVYHGEAGQLEYDFVVAPGVDPGGIVVEISGASDLSITAAGELAIRTERGVVLEPVPRVYQPGPGGVREEVAARYRLVGANRVGFEVAAYDRGKDLVIDPEISYSTYLGGTGYDEVRGLAVDGAGNLYLTGTTFSSDLPTLKPYQAALSGSADAFVEMIAPAGNTLVYSTYLGGTTSVDSGESIAVDAAGNAYILGAAGLAFPTTMGAFQTALIGGVDAFVTKLSPSGNSLVYSTYLGGAADETPGRIAIDAAGSAYVTGSTASSNFPVQGAFQGTFQGAPRDAFVTKLSTAGNTLVYSTYLGGSADDAAFGIAVDAAGAAYVGGLTTSSNFPTSIPFQAALAGTQDAFVTKVLPAGNAVDYSTYLGGSGVEGCNVVAVDSSGSAYVSGFTVSTNFPLKNPLQATSGGGRDVFVTKLTSKGNTLVYSTYLGGSSLDEATGIAVDGAGNLFLAGMTLSTNFPTKDPLQAAGAGNADAFVARLSAAGDAIVHSTYLGGSGTDLPRGLALDATGAIYVAGTTTSTNLPTKSALAKSLIGGVNDGFATKLVIPPVVLSPSAPTVAPKGTIKFVASGGSGSGYVYTLATDGSGALVKAATGDYQAGDKNALTADVLTDVVKVTDSYGGTATATVKVGPGLTLDPATVSVRAGDKVAFTAKGGGGGYAFKMDTNESGGTIDPATGAYTAGTTAPSTDRVSVKESLGIEAKATVTVTAAPIPTDAGAPAPTASSGPACVVPPDDDFLTGGGGGCGLTDTPPGRAGGALLAIAAVSLVLRRRRGAARCEGYCSRQ